MQVDDEELLEQSLVEIERRDLQALVMLAGEGKALANRVPDALGPVGGMPVTSTQLDGRPADLDPRVRRAAGDRAAVGVLIEQA